MGRIIEIEIENLKQINDLLGALPDRMRAETNKALRYSATLIQRNARIAAPVRSGYLRNSISIRYLVDAVVIEPKARYALYVHEGTGMFGPHHSRIVPKTKKVMAWEGGHFAASTAGQRANPFMERAVERSRGEINEAFRQAVRNVLRAA